MIKRLAILSAFISMLCLSACAPNTAGVKLSSDGSRQVDNTRVARSISVVNNQMRQVGDLLQGSATLISDSSKDQSLQYRFTWYDLQGFVVDGDSIPWTPIIIHGKQSKQIESVAPNSVAHRFEVYVRKVH
ncbi:YcfL family protein [Parashewanella spongiae]|nr:YcfL family protein [Parashewanella spongiae]MCL1077890.1 YcfL family protein [Parashewanella spongiae]